MTDPPKFLIKDLEANGYEVDMSSTILSWLEVVHGGINGFKLPFKNVDSPEPSKSIPAAAQLAPAAQFQKIPGPQTYEKNTNTHAIYCSHLAPRKRKIMFLQNSAEFYHHACMSR